MIPVQWGEDGVIFQMVTEIYFLGGQKNVDPHNMGVLCAGGVDNRANIFYGSSFLAKQMSVSSERGRLAQRESTTLTR